MLIASGIALITKEHVPKAVLIPSVSVAAFTIAGLFAVQIGLHRERQRALKRGPRPPPPAGVGSPGLAGVSWSSGFTGPPGLMDFDVTPRVDELRNRIRAFMDEHVFPAEVEAMKALDAEVGPGTPYPEILVEIRSRAPRGGLWNLFMPDERYGAGLGQLGVRGALRGEV